MMNVRGIVEVESGMDVVFYYFSVVAVGIFFLNILLFPPSVCATHVEAFKRLCKKMR